MDFCLFLMLSFSLSSIVFYTDGTFRALGTNKASNMAFRNGVIREIFFFSLSFVASSLLLEHGSVQDYYMDGDAQ